MSNQHKLIYLICLSILSFSCVEKKGVEDEVGTVVRTNNVVTDTLKFTSGISAIFQDSNNNYWFGSLREGVAMYDGQSFTYFTAADGLTDNQIHAIQEDDKGVIWFDTQTGVSSYDGETIINHTDTESLQMNLITKARQPIQGEWQKTDNDLWFEADVREGVYRFDGQQLYYLPFPPHKTLNLVDNLFATTDISKGKNRIWLATYAGVFGYDGQGFTVINDETLGYDRDIAPLHIRSILEDSKGRLWIGNNGIGVLLRENGLITNFSEDNNLIHPSSGRRGDKSPPNTLEHVFEISEDSQGNIWFGDRDGGVWRYDGENMVNYSQKDGLKHDFALSIYEDKHQNLWFGMRDGSVYLFVGDAFERIY